MPAASPDAASRVVFCIVILLAAVHFYRSPRSASDLEIVPDSVEYAVAAQRFATLGTCDIAINRVPYPSRYPPGFSVVVLSPFYRFVPGELGIGIVPVYLFAVAGVAMAFAIAHRIAGPWAGAVAALGLIYGPVYGANARLIMTDVPTAALGLLGCCLFVHEPRTAFRGHGLIVGLVVAAAAMLRGLYAGLLLPVLWDGLRRRRWAEVTLALLPMAALLIATGYYNHRTFGGARRTGYHFWCPVPYDFPALTFSPKYLRANLATLASLWFPLLAGAAGLVALIQARRTPAASRLLIYTGLTLLPITAFHLLYFFQDARFYIALVAFAWLIAGIGLTPLLPQALLRRRWSPIVIVLLAFIPAFRRPNSAQPQRRLIADRMNAMAPNDAVIVTALDSVYLEPLVLRGTSRTVIPLSRRCEYASKLVAPRAMRGLPSNPPSPVEHRWAPLRDAGARDVIPLTADEQMEQLIERAKAGEPIFFDFSQVADDDPARVRIEKAFRTAGVRMNTL